MTVTRLDFRPVAAEPYRPMPPAVKRRNLAAVRALRAALPTRPDPDLAGVPAHERHQEALTRITTRARSTDR